MNAELLHLYVSPGHNFVGHHGQPAGTHPVHEVPEVRCVAGRGLEGDRYFDHKADYKGQITFFADEVYRDLCARFQVQDKPPSVFRRNVITRGVDLNALVGQEFDLQGVRFLGVEVCKPCYWMDQAFCPGAEAALVGRGGLRAKILNTGVLRTSVPAEQNHAVAKLNGSDVPFLAKA
jgi:MOSC domain-containing protein YiiM